MSRRSLPSFAVVIPAYNEAVGIAACVDAVHGALDALPNRTALIVVDDGSADATADVLRGLEPRYARLEIVFRGANGGYGAALRTGCVTAAEQGFDFVLFMDSDLTNDPRYLAAFADRMADGYDVIKASRYSPGGGTDGVPLARVVPSVIGNAVARVLYGLPVRDCTNGFRAARTELLVGLDLHETGFSIIMEELYRIRSTAQTYANVPIVLTSRAEHLRSSSFDYRPRAMWRYLRYPLASAVGRVRARL